MNQRKSDDTLTPPNPQKSAKRMAFVQLTRFGDLIQTAQVAHILRHNNPNIELILIARKRFSKPLNFLLSEIFTEIYELEDTAKIADIGEKQAYIENFVADVNATPYDALLNLSYSKSK